MGRKKPNTPRSRIKAAIRQLWLRSRERAAAIKSTGYCCADCGAKQSRAKGREVYIEVHHDPEIGDKWEKIFTAIEQDILRSPQIPLCKSCHKERHEEAHKELL